MARISVRKDFEDYLIENTEKGQDVEEYLMDVTDYNPGDQKI